MVRFPDGLFGFEEERGFLLLPLELALLGPGGGGAVGGLPALLGALLDAAGRGGTSVPIEIEMRTSRAQLQYTRGTAELEISRDKGGLSIKSRPIQLGQT